MDVDSAREDTRDVLEVSGEIQEKPSGRQGDRDWHYDDERYEDADHFSAVERRELYNSIMLSALYAIDCLSVCPLRACIIVIIIHKRLKLGSPYGRPSPIPLVLAG